MKKYTMFLDGAVWLEGDDAGPFIDAMPDGCYLYSSSSVHKGSPWFDKNLSQVLAVDVPKEYRLLVLLLT